ncbi:hypothetical protein [Bradyrhizobium sp. 23]|nr:hypothetical protein [Bradyrhizobium sp. 23]
MNAVKTFPKAMKLIASTAPDETVSVNRSRSRRLIARTGMPGSAEITFMKHSLEFRD